MTDAPPRLVTAIIPLKNYVERFLREALASLCRQTCPAWKAVIVVEPADRDTFRTLLAAELADSRFTLVTNEGKKLAGAINTGLRCAETPFVALLLADDLWAPETVEVLSASIAREPAVDFFHSSRVALDDVGVRSAVMPSIERFTVDDFVWRSPVKHLLCFRRTTALAVGGVDESLPSIGSDDYDFPWTMAERGAHFSAIPDALYIYRDHREGYRLTTDLPRSVHMRGLARILRKHGVGWWTVARVVWTARNGYLRQCLYRNALDRWLKERLGADSRRGFRLPYPRA